MKNLKGIAIQEGIEVEKIIISANAQSLGYTSKENTDISIFAKDNLHEIAKAIKETNIGQIEVVGYTDNQGDEELNKKISERRAKIL